MPKRKPIRTNLDKPRLEWLAAGGGPVMHGHERIEVIDDVLDFLEERHLAGMRDCDGSVRRIVGRLQESVGIPLPAAALRVRSTFELHDLLLDWQDIVLDEVAPWRRAVIDSLADMAA